MKRFFLILALLIVISISFAQYDALNVRMFSYIENCDEYDVFGDSLFCRLNDEVYLMDVSSPHTPNSLGCFDIPTYSLVDVTTNGYNFYMLIERGYSSDGHIYIYDITDFSDASRLFDYSSFTYFKFIEIYDSIAYVYQSGSGDDGFFIFNIFSPCSLEYINRFSRSGVRDYYIEDGFVYVAIDNGLLSIFSVQVPSLPYETRSLECSTRAYGVHKDGDYAYLACNEGLVVVDVSDPYEPFVVVTFETGISCKSVYIDGNYAFVAASDSGLRIIDVSNPEAPFEVGFFDANYHSMEEVYVQNSKAFVRSDERRLYILDVSYFLGSDVDEKPAQTPQNYALSAYPNPFNSTVEINIPGGASKIEIFDTYGRSVLKSTMPTNSLTWSPSEETSSGVYIVNAKTLNGTTLTEKVIHAK